MNKWRRSSWLTWLLSPNSFLLVIGLVLVGLSILEVYRRGQFDGNLHFSSAAEIDLSQIRWYVRQGFSESYRNGFEKDDPGVKIVDRFPIRLNGLFDIQPGNTVNEFSLMSSFDLTRDQVDLFQMISLPEIGENWAVYLNGRELRREIYLDGQGDILFHRSEQMALISIPPETSRIGANLLVFRILGHAPLTGLFPGWFPGFTLSEGYVIGTSQDLIDRRSLRDLLGWFQMGAYLILAIYQFLLYFRQKEDHLLYFGIFLITCAGYGLINSIVAYTIILDTAWLQKIMYAITLSWIGLVGLTLDRFLYPARHMDRGVRVVMYFSFTGILFDLILPYPWAETILYASLPALFLGLLYLSGMIVQAYRRKIPDAKKVLIAGSIIFGMVLWTLLDLIFIRSGIDVIGWFPFFLALAFMVIFVDRFWKANRDLVQSNQKLIQLHEGMEEEIKLRTRALLETNGLLEEKLDEIGRLQLRLSDMASHDQLTGLLNRWKLDEIMVAEFASAIRNGSHLSLIMCDIDHFKILNDTYGHNAGDLVLKEYGALLTSYVRKSDYAFRYGGEEFLILLPGASMKNACMVAEELCRKTKQLVFLHEARELKISISIGVAEFPLHGSSADEILKMADEALYTAKINGRDRVETASYVAG